MGDAQRCDRCACIVRRILTEFGANGKGAAAAAIVAVMASGDLLLLFGALLPAIIVLYIVAMQRDKFE